MEIKHYLIIDKLYESYKTIVYQGFSQLKEQKVILKYLKEDYPHPFDIYRYQQEYNLTNQHNLEGMIKSYEFIPYKRSFIILFEDFGATSLKYLFKQKILSLEEFFPIAIKVSDILGLIHKAKIIHKDINPSNIVMNPVTRELKIIDFGLATQLSQEHLTLRNPHLLEGTLGYISPEQTGRMNRSIDYRTDLYSLGVTFYELLTGQLPFKTNDILELIHCHLAKQPVLPHKINPILPPIISEIIIKLMAKDVEKRYQSAWGLKADLEKCWEQWTNKTTIINFSLGDEDIIDRFQIPQKLYGREVEIETLLNSFARASEGEKELMLITGYSGIGKSALVKEIYKPITEKKGYFISGKFEQMQRNIPYASIIQAFSELIKQILTEPPEIIAQYKTKILEELGSNSQVIIEVIPELELIISKQPELNELSPTENQNRFNLVFQKFINIFAKKEHPLVIFLDDLQWADIASLKLLQLMMTQENINYLFLIGAYRSKEVTQGHILPTILREMQTNGVNINQIYLDCLKIKDIQNILTDIFHSPKDQSLLLAELVSQKTEGNPFFINQFLQSLYNEDLIRFNPIQKTWEWEIEKIKAAPLPDDIVDLIASKIKKLPPLTQQVLKLAACIGNIFDLETLSIVAQQSIQVVAADLLGAIKEGLIIPRDDEYKLICAGIVPDNVKICYRFVHDRIQQAAYSLIPLEEKQAIHLDIGNLLLKHLPYQQEEEKIFDIVNQLNIGIALLDNSEIKNNLANLNWLAGKKAKSSAAYESAFSYFQIGLQLLPVDTWEKQYNFTLDLYLQCAEMAYLCGDLAAMEELGSIILNQAYDILDQAKLYEIKLSAYVCQQRPLEAIEIGKKVLGILGLKNLDKMNKVKFFLSFLELNRLLIVKKTSQIAKNPVSTTPKTLAILKIINRLLPSVFLVQDNIMLILINQVIKLSNKYGNSAFSVYPYAFNGAICCGALGKINTGYEWGQLALTLSRELKATPEEAKILTSINFCVKPWRENAHNLLPSLKESYQKSLEVGDLEFAGYAADIYGIYCLYTHQDLNIADQELFELSDAIKSFKQERNYYQLQSSRQVIENLIKSPEDPHILNGKHYDLNQRLPIGIKTGDYSQVFHVYTYQLILSYLFGENVSAIDNANNAEKYLKAGMGTMTVAMFCFYDCLARLANCTTGDKHNYKLIKKRLNYNLKKLKKWAKYAPMNYLHKYYLVQAENYRVLSKDNLAQKSYELAINLANKYEFIQEEALAYELAAKFYLSQGQKIIARAYFQEAHYCYLRWGAISKVKHLEKAHSEIFSSKSDAPVDVSISISQKSNQNLDLESLFNASQTIVEELSLDKLLIKLMRILLTTSGAERGYLLVNKNNELYIEVQGEAMTDKFTILSDKSVKPELANTVINYVVNSNNHLVLDEAFQSGDFTQDHYIKQNQIKSILCSPLIAQGQLKGIIYLENNLTTGAFTSERLRIIQILSQQAAIALENAQLYNNLEHRVLERTQELSQTLATLQVTQQELINSEKMAALGQMIAGIAHEINTPLGVISSSIGYISNFFGENLPSFLEFWHSLSPESQSEFNQLLKKINQASPVLSTREQRQIKKDLLIQLQSYNLENPEQIAKMLLSIGVYQEVENLRSLLNNQQRDELLKTASTISNIQTSIKNIVTAIEKSSKIVFALKTYARYDQKNQKNQADIIQGIETVLTLYQNLFKQGVEVVRDYPDNLPLIWCYPEELNQVWTNLIYNSLQAMEYRGILTIEVAMQDKQLKVNITDTGCGIPPEIISKIFEPFFTTKPPGEGSGLGLHIAKQIVQKHDGEIIVTSQPGKTTFMVSFPWS